MWRTNQAEIEISIGEHTNILASLIYSMLLMRAVDGNDDDTAVNVIAHPPSI